MACSEIFCTSLLHVLDMELMWSEADICAACNAVQKSHVLIFFSRLQSCGTKLLSRHVSPDSMSQHVPVT